MKEKKCWCVDRTVWSEPEFLFQFQRSSSEFEIKRIGFQMSKCFKCVCANIILF